MLDKKEIKYVVDSDIDRMLKEGLTEVPVLDIEGTRLNYQEAINWLMQKGNND